jgi:uncharacterized protein YlxW (UPF0749 family)
MKIEKERLKIGIILGLMCCFLTVGIITQIKTVKNSTTTVGKTQTENELRDSVLRWKEKYDNAYAKLDKKEKELEKLREQVSNSTDSAKGLSSKLERYNLLLGKSDLIGKGITITLKDGDPRSIGDPIVHAQDVLNVVNSLKNAGAEAISVNNQRIVNTTSYNCVGNVITINGEKVGAPFNIKAIGLPTQLYGSLTMQGQYLDILEEQGVIVDIKQVEKDTIIVPKYEGIYKFEYASNIE